MSSSDLEASETITRALLSEIALLPSERKPQHIAIIMDGNGRWAERRGLARAAGHEAGTENIRRITRAVVEAGIPYLTLWAFSTENWRRPQEEIDALMRILGLAIEREVDELARNGVQLRHIGRLDGLPKPLADSVQASIDSTAPNDRLVLTLAFNYGSRQEIVDAVRGIVAAGIPADQIDEETINQFLYTSDIPEPDLVIRTSGEYRMSNFLLWQAAFAELFFTPVLWPDFGPEHLLEAVVEYSNRERRFGNTTAAAGRRAGGAGK